MNDQSDLVVKAIQNGQGALTASHELIHAVSTMLVAAIQSVSNASADIGAIASSAREETVASNDIATNMERIAQTVEESAVAVNEVAEAASHLQKLSNRLSAATEKFKLG